MLVHAPLKDLESVEAAIASLNAVAPSTLNPPSRSAVETNPPADNHRTNSSSKKVPVLGDVPVVGNLFRNESEGPTDSNTPPGFPQVSIRARFVTMFEKDLRALRFAWYPGKSAGSIAAPSQPKASATANPPTVTAILSDEQFRADFEKLEHQKDAEILGATAITTLSGREAQIQVGETKTVVNGIKWSLPQTLNSTEATTTNGLPVTYLTDSVSVGPMLDVLPTVAADLSSIQLNLTPAVWEFLGYDQPGAPLVYEDNPVPGATIHGTSTLPRQGTSVLTSMNATTTRATLPLPHFRLRSVQAEAKVLDGQTVVLASPKSVDVAAQPISKPPTKPNQREKIFLVFVTTTLLDPAGNPVHSHSKTSTPKAD